MFKFFKNKSEKIRYVVSRKPKQEAPKSFFELSSREQKGIIERATAKANEEQQKLIRSIN